MIKPTIDFSTSGGETPYFWGKAELDHDTQAVKALLPLAVHCVDVACTFRQLAELPLFLRRLEAAANQPLSPIHLDRMAVLAFLHDIGKANLGFQNKIFDPNAPRAGHVRELAPLLYEEDLSGVLFEALDLSIMEQWFETPETLCDFLLASWSHHGSPAAFNANDKTGNYYLAKTQWWRSDGQKDPLQEIASLAAIARDAFPLAFEPCAKVIPGTPALQHRFAGLVMLADWLGSHQKFFPLDRQANGEPSFASCVF